MPRRFQATWAWVLRGNISARATAEATLETESEAGALTADRYLGRPALFESLLSGSAFERLALEPAGHNHPPLFGDSGFSRAKLPPPTRASLYGGEHSSPSLAS